MFAANAEVETLFGVVRLLHVAVQHAVDDEARVEIAKLLVEHGADPQAKLPAR